MQAWRVDNRIADTLQNNGKRNQQHEHKKESRIAQHDPFEDETHLAHEYRSSKISIFYEMLWEWEEKLEGAAPETSEGVKSTESQRPNIGIEVSSSITEWKQTLSVIKTPQRKKFVSYKHPKRCLEGCGDTREFGSVCKCGSDGKLHCLHPKTWRIGATYYFHARDHDDKVLHKRQGSHRRMMTLPQVYAVAELESKLVSQCPPARPDKFRMFSR